MEPSPRAPAAALRAAYAHCFRIARHAENFPVASRLLPGSMRPHLAAVYAYARGADDIADEPRPRIGCREVSATVGARLAALDHWEAGLDGAVPAGTEPVFEALAATRDACGIDERWLRALLVAFREDVTRSRVPTWEALRRYADHSAAPVGRLVLEIAGVRDEDVARRSDDLCVALQWTNLWQDLALDWERGRLYLPEEAWTRAGSLPQGTRLDPRALPPALIAAHGDAIRRTAALYERTRDLPERAGPPLRRYLHAVWLGGRAVLRAVEELGPRAFAERASLPRWRKLRIAAAAVLGTGSR